MKKLALCLAVLAAPHLSFAEEISAADLPAKVAELHPEILIVGEVHDNPAHHLNQAAAVAALKPRVLVFEMLTPDQALLATPQARKDLSTLGKVLGWEEAGWPDFATYAPIFAAAPDAMIMGAAVPREQVKRAFEEPVDKVFGAGGHVYGLDKPYAPEVQAQLEAEIAADHCGALPDDLLPGMVAAQRLRDANFANTVMRAAKTTGGPVVLITGSGHARTDRGVGAMILHAVPGRDVVSIGQLEAPAEGDQPFDWWVVTPPAEREDPCKAFQ